jgi:hypothetical protein
MSTVQVNGENYTDKRFSASKAIVLTLKNTLQLQHMDSLVFYHLRPTKSNFNSIYVLCIECFLKMAIRNSRNMLE